MRPDSWTFVTPNNLTRFYHCCLLALTGVVVVPRKPSGEEPGLRR